MCHGADRQAVFEECYRREPVGIFVDKSAGQSANSRVNVDVGPVRRQPAGGCPHPQGESHSQRGTTGQCITPSADSSMYRRGPPVCVCVSAHTSASQEWLSHHRLEKGTSIKEAGENTKANSPMVPNLTWFDFLAFV